MSRRLSILRDSSVYSVSTLFEQVCGMLNGFFIARLLGPQVQGIWQTIRLIVRYGEYAGLGQLFGMRREVGVAMGRDDHDEVAKQRDSSLIWNVASMTAASLLIGLYILFFAETYALRLALAVIALFLPLRSVNGFFNIWFKGIGRFGVLSYVAMATGLTYLFGILLIYLFGFAGAVAGFLLIIVVQLVIHFRHFQSRFRLQFDKAAWRRSFLMGLPIFISGLCYLFFDTIDRVVVIAQLGFTSMGFYSISTMAFMPFHMLIGSAALVLFPHTCRLFGEKGLTPELHKHLEEPMDILMLTLPTLALWLALLIPPVVRLVLGDYAAGIVPAQIVIFGLPFAAASAFCSNVLQAAGKQWWLAAGSLVGGIVKALLIWLLLALNKGLAGIALAASVAFAAHYFLLFLASARSIRLPARVQLRLSLGVLALTSACAVLAWWIGDITTLFLPTSVTSATMMWLLCLLSLVPCVFAAIRLLAPGKAS